MSICRIHVNLPCTLRDTWQCAIYISETSDTQHSAINMSICRIHYWNEQHISICRIQINLPYTMSATRQLAVYNARHVPICRIHLWNERHTSIGRILFGNEGHVPIFFFFEEGHISICCILFNFPYTFQFSAYDAQRMSICRIHLRNERHTCNLPYNLP